MKNASSGEKVTLAGFPVLLKRKKVRRVTIAVLPPYGEVRVTAPDRTPLSEIESIVSGKRAWLETKIATFSADPGKERTYGEGEYALLWGRRLRIFPRVGAPGVSLTLDGMILSARIDDPAKRAAALEAFYRKEVQTEAEKLLPFLFAMTGLSPAKITVRKMARRWGTCYHRTGTVHLSLSLAEYPPECLSYVLLHELLHLRYPDHGREFHAALDRYMPENREVAAELNRMHRRSYGAWADLPQTDPPENDPF
ncbi:MAG: M48 family metallopeptidase [Clostridia bacterium]|nr:M48 family metallopeptidase [Clostridia bacterium]